MRDGDNSTVEGMRIEVGGTVVAVLASATCGAPIPDAPEVKAEQAESPKKHKSAPAGRRRVLFVARRGSILLECAIERTAMTTGKHWVDWNDPDPVALTRFLEGCDRVLGHEPFEVTADEVSHLARPGSLRRLAEGSRTVGVVSVIRGDLALVRVSMSAAERGPALDEAMSWVRPRLGGGAMWLPDGDAEAATAARAAGFAREYVDLQMTRAVPWTHSPAPPVGFTVVDLDSSSMRAVHDLVCRTWSVDPHLAAFEERFARSTEDPSLWVLLTPTTGVSTGRLVAAAWGVIQPSRDGPVGEVAHLDVDPDHRRQGLGPWALSELVCRLKASDPRINTARLGVHDDNASNAADLYRRIGWEVVSRHQKWTVPDPA